MRFPTAAYIPRTIMWELWNEVKLKVLNRLVTFMTELTQVRLIQLRFVILCFITSGVIEWELATAFCFIPKQLDTSYGGWTERCVVPCSRSAHDMAVLTALFPAANLTPNNTHYRVSQRVILHSEIAVTLADHSIIGHTSRQLAAQSCNCTFNSNHNHHRHLFHNMFGQP
jgi:hypothetical protein